MAFLDSLERTDPYINDIAAVVQRNRKQGQDEDRYARLKAALQVQEPGAPAPSAPVTIPGDPGVTVNKQVQNLYDTDTPEHAQMAARLQADDRANNTAAGIYIQPSVNYQSTIGKTDPRVARLQATLQGPPVARDLRPDELTPAKMAELQNIAGKGPGDAIDNLLAQVGQERTQQAMIDRIKGQENFELSRDQLREQARISDDARKLANEKDLLQFKQSLTPAQLAAITEDKVERNGQEYLVGRFKQNGAVAWEVPTGKAPKDEGDKTDSDYYQFDDNGNVTGVAPNLTAKDREGLRKELDAREDRINTRISSLGTQAEFNKGNKDSLAAIDKRMKEAQGELDEINHRRSLLDKPSGKQPAGKPTAQPMSFKALKDSLQKAGRLDDYTDEEIRAIAQQNGIQLTD